MQNTQTASNPGSPVLLATLRFWEPRRLLYNSALTVVVLLWVIATWPHFRPAFTASALVAMLMLALLANVCYCAAYLADGAIQSLLPEASWGRYRWAVLILGTLLALVFENYWIADEIYPSVPNDMPNFLEGLSSHFASNMNLPAPVAVLAFLAAFGGTFLAGGAAAIAWFIRRPKFARTMGMLVAVGAVIYFGLLFGLSLASHDSILSRGQEKYFCEIDCHLAYSVVEVKTESAAATTRYFVTLRTRFDETTISSSRPKDATLTPNPRLVRLIDPSGREYPPAAIHGTSLDTPLRPTDSYTTELEFDLPKDATASRLLVTTKGAQQHLMIGDENSLLHKKTYFAL
jgi:hypothetical protein